MKEVHGRRLKEAPLRCVFVALAENAAAGTVSGRSYPVKFPQIALALVADRAQIRYGTPPAIG